MSKCHPRLAILWGWEKTVKRKAKVRFHISSCHQTLWFSHIYSIWVLLPKVQKRLHIQILTAPAPKPATPKNIPVLYVTLRNSMMNMCQLLCFYFDPENWNNWSIKAAGTKARIYICYICHFFHVWLNNAFVTCVCHAAANNKEWSCGIFAFFMKIPRRNVLQVFLFNWITETAECAQPLTAAMKFNLFPKKLDFTKWRNFLINTHLEPNFCLLTYQNWRQILGRNLSQISSTSAQCGHLTLPHIWN